jgi:hydroxymethylpyrimidine/phosphomethylpyrimidine kinase
VRRRAAPPVVVAIGGFDPSCGAGVVADARSIEAMAAVPSAVVTALTVQSGSGVHAVFPVPVSRVLAQFDELLAAWPVAAVKIGQVPTAALARALARRLKGLAIPVVLDPVRRASGGGSLVARGAGPAVLTALLPVVSLVTVNLDEAAAATGRPVRTQAAMSRAAAALEGRGAQAVLVKGGHLDGDPLDLLRQGGRETWMRGRRLAGAMHGTGCALASATAARLAFGRAL